MMTSRLPVRVTGGRILGAGTVGVALVGTALFFAACGSGGGGKGGNATAVADRTTSAQAGAAGQGNGPLKVGADGVTNVDGAALQGQLDSLPKGELTAADRASLAYMREEEKLAGDVYAVLYAKWQTPIFNNISSAEQTHTGAVKALLDRYQLADPAASKPAGSYENADIQALFSTLVAQGNTSLVDALQVGATIEDLDIYDLQLRKSDMQDIALVYANLEKGSRNHLRAFVAQLTARSAIYTPTHISQAEFDSIVSSETEQGSAR